MRLLVTGGAGFIASHITEHFVARGDEVHVADRFSYAGKLRNLERVASDVRLWYGDLKDAEFCERLAAFPFDAVIHAAGNTHVDRAIADPAEFTLDNVLSANRLLDAFWKSGRVPSRIVVYSTDEVFGSTPAGAIFPEDTPYNPSNAYSASKVGVEAVCRSFVVTHDMPIIIVRPCNTYGPRQHPEKAIPRFTAQALRGEALTIHNDGSGARDWLHTYDHCSAVEAVLKHGEPGTSYNFGRGDEHTDMEVGRAVCDVLDVPFTYRLVPGRPGHDRRYWMCGRRLRGLGWLPRVHFNNGLAETVNWSRNNPDWWLRDDVPVAAFLKAV